MKEINIMTMQEGLHKLMGEDYSKCSGTAHKNGYMVFFNQKPVVYMITVEKTREGESREIIDECGQKLDWSEVEE